MTRIRVLVVEDSITVRKRLIEVLEQDPDLEVVGEAIDGRQAIELCDQLRPDVVTLDIVMPIMSGLAATEYIMAHFPTPILIVSASFNRGELYKTYEALAAGALDVMDKPSGDEIDPDWEHRFRQSVKLLSRIKVITHPRAKLSRSRGEMDPLPTHHPSDLSYELAAIGASTGGPSAILEILRGLPSDFPLPILFVIHIGEPFGNTFAEWLNSQSPIAVRLAKDGEPQPRPGKPIMLMAPSDRHLEVQDGRLRLTLAPERHACRPSVDVLFDSIARNGGHKAVACLLTGMGRDGAAGLLAIKRAGGLTIAQDEASSVVFGMPREAIRLGAADRVLPLQQIAPTLRALAAQRR